MRENDKNAVTRDEAHKVVVDVAKEVLEIIYVRTQKYHNAQVFLLRARIVNSVFAKHFATIRNMADKAIEKELD